MGSGKNQLIMYYLTKDETINNTRMLTLLIKDPWTYIASIGTAFFITIDWVARNMTPIATFIGAVIGIAVLCVGFVTKLKEKKNADLEEQIKRHELRKLMRDELREIKQ